MLLDLAAYAAVIVTLFAIVDPIGTLPFFVALTEGFDEADRKVMVRRSVLVCAGVLGGFALVGRFLFTAFGFTLGAFEIAGGIILFLIAYDMLHGELTRTKITTADRDEAIARRDELSVVPIGIPLLAGPGAISTVMIYEGEAGGDPFTILGAFVAIAIVAVATFIVLHFGQRILRSIGRVGIMALTRILGLVLAAVGVQFVVYGVIAVLPHA